jgi:hypothetical protein
LSLSNTNTNSNTNSMTHYYVYFLAAAHHAPHPSGTIILLGNR